MKLIVAGVGPGDPELVTGAALKAVSEADLVLEPLSKAGRDSVAGMAVRAHLPDAPYAPMVFPMTLDTEKRDASLREQLEALRPRWKGAKTVVLPVIGDSSLYATGAYLFEVWKEKVPDLELGLVPGISAHSLAASCAARFLAMGDEVLSVIPATASRAKIDSVLRAADVVAMYKPSALREDLKAAVLAAGPWREMVRVDRAGLPNERIFRGDSALESAGEYLSLLLLWR